jgi:hypothetical protein
VFKFSGQILEKGMVEINGLSKKRNLFYENVEENGR